MTTEAALNILHAELPREAVFGVQENEWTMAKRLDGQRLDPPQYWKETTWAVSISYMVGLAYLSVTMEGTLEKSLAVALERFRHWQSTGETVSDHEDAPAKPPRLSAPGAAERVEEERIRNEFESFPWEEAS